MNKKMKTKPITNQLLQRVAMMLIVMLMTGVATTSCSNDNDTDSTNWPIDPDGELLVNGTLFKVESEKSSAELIVTYISPDGLYMPNEITLEINGKGEIVREDVYDKKSKKYEISIGTYIVKADGLSITVEVRLKQDQ